MGRLPSSQMSRHNTHRPRHFCLLQRNRFSPKYRITDRPHVRQSFFWFSPHGFTGPCNSIYTSCCGKLLVLGLFTRFACLVQIQVLNAAIIFIKTARNVLLPYSEFLVTLSALAGMNVLLKVTPATFTLMHPAIFIF